MELTNTHNLPQPIVEAIIHANEEYDFKEGPFSISVTSLLGPVGIRKLRMKYWDKIEVDAMDQIWQLLGTVMHGILERSGTNHINEQRYSIKFGGWTISGKFDSYGLLDQELIDYKFVSGSVVQYNPRGKQEWHQQLNVLRYILKQHGIEIKKMSIIPIIRDWTPRAAKTSQMPDHPVLKIDIPMWDDETIEQYLSARINLYETYERNDTIPVCTMEERWQKPPQFAVKKKGASRAVAGGIHGSYQDAINFIVSKGYKESDYMIEERASVPTRCLGYCSVKKFCPWYQDYNKQTNDSFMEDSNEF